MEGKANSFGKINPKVQAKEPKDQKINEWNCSNF